MIGERATAEPAALAHPEQSWTDALLAVALLAVDPRLGGISVRALPGPVRDRFLAELRHSLPPDSPFRRLPQHAADDSLLGGIDLPATLRAGRPIAKRGLLAEADGGIVVVAMAERMSSGIAARLGAALDSAEVVVERDGVALRLSASIGVVALDEGIAEDERPPPALLDRLAFHLALERVGLRDLAASEHDGGHIRAARALLPQVTVPDAVVQAICGTASVLGVASMRALLLTVRATRAAAALGGRWVAAPTDAMTAARLVLAPRATTLPPAPPEPPGEQQDPKEAGADADDPPPGDDEQAAADRERPIDAIVLEAAKAAMPAGLLARLAAGREAPARASPAGRAGAAQHSLKRGRPIGARRGELRAGARLNLVETLRAAAPWQTVRRRALPRTATARIIVEQGDFRVTRFRRRTETTTIFLVDASGSAALNRLAEAKGAVELVLADCYVRRDRVALIAFRGTGAELLLPPTSSLVRARRCLAAMPGGGGTPLAAGMEAATLLADAIRRKGQSPVVILLSDGRANVARDGTSGRARAEADAVSAGRALRGAGTPSVLVDTSPRPSPQARRLADQMGALYVPLPYADAHAVSRAVRAGARA